MKIQAISLAVLMMSMLVLSACGRSTAIDENLTAVTPTSATDNVVVAEGRVEPAHYARIAFMVTGTVSEVLVEDGQAVKKGQPLIHLRDESDSNYRAAQLDLVTAEKALNDLKDAAGADLAQTIIDLKDASEEYDDAVDYLQYLQNNKKIPQTESRRVWVKTSQGYQYVTRTREIKGPAPQDWIIEAENDAALKKAKVDELQRSYERLKDGVDADQVAVLESRLAAAKARVGAFSIMAPFDGVVVELNARTDNSIEAGKPVVTIADTLYWVVKTTDLTEIDVVKVKEGQPVTVVFDAIPGTELEGRVASIGQKFSEQQGDVVYEVTVTLDHGHRALRWGMTAEVRFK